MTAFRFLLLSLIAAKTSSYENDSSVVTVKVGSDAVLPCSISTKENIESKRYDWRKDGEKEVFKYDAGLHDNNGLPGQDEQFKGRVSHFPGELKNGNASIVITNVTTSDGGNYTCVFSQKGEKVIIQLVVVVSSTKLHIRIVNVKEDGVLLQCEARGASSKPNLKWQNSSGHILPTKEPRVVKNEGSFDVFLQTTVTKMDTYRCVATQKEIHHQGSAEIYAFIRETQSCWDQNLTFYIIPVVSALFFMFTVCLFSVFYNFVWWRRSRSAHFSIPRRKCKNRDLP